MPHADSSGNILLFNGKLAPHATPCVPVALIVPCMPERLAFRDVLVDASGVVFGGLPVPDGANDGAALMAALGEQGSCIVGVLSQLRGPWALVYWHAPSQTLWFGRDAIGGLPLQQPTGGFAAHLGKSYCRADVLLFVSLLTGADDQEWNGAQTHLLVVVAFSVV